jgi:nitrogen fixation/metabolism regulation signal transduction histidine kinase
MKKQGNMSSPKLNSSAATNTNDSEVGEITKNFKKMINEIKENTNKCLNEFQENAKS